MLLMEAEAEYERSRPFGTVAVTGAQSAVLFAGLTKRLKRHRSSLRRKLKSSRTTTPTKEEKEKESTSTTEVMPKVKTTTPTMEERARSVIGMTTVSGTMTIVRRRRKHASECGREQKLLPVGRRQAGVAVIVCAWRSHVRSQVLHTIAVLLERRQ